MKTLGRDPLGCQEVGPSFKAKIQPGATAEEVPVGIYVDAAAAKGKRPFSVSTAAGKAQSPPGVVFTVATVPPAPPRVRSVEEVKGIGPKYASRLKESGITDLSRLASASPAVVAKATGGSEARAIEFVNEAKRLLKTPPL